MLLRIVGVGCSEGKIAWNSRIGADATDDGERVLPKLTETCFEGYESESEMDGVKSSRTRRV